MSDVVVKIHHGTGRLTGESLCRSCTNGGVRVDQRGEVTYCSAFRCQPRGSVTECSAYYNRSLPDLNDFRRIAWTLRTEKGGRAIGFAPPEKYAQQYIAHGSPSE